MLNLYHCLADIPVRWLFILHWATWREKHLEIESVMKHESITILSALRHIDLQTLFQYKLRCAGGRRNKEIFIYIFAGTRERAEFSHFHSLTIYNKRHEEYSSVWHKIRLEKMPLSGKVHARIVVSKMEEVMLSEWAFFPPFLAIQAYRIS